MEKRIMENIHRRCIDSKDIEGRHIAYIHAESINDLQRRYCETPRRDESKLQSRKAARIYWGEESRISSMLLYRIS
jgi:hypothetical protein